MELQRDILINKPKYEEKNFFNPLKKQEWTTPQEFNDYLDSIGVKRMTVAGGGRIGLKDGMDRRTFMKIMGWSCIDTYSW